MTLDVTGYEGRIPQYTLAALTRYVEKGFQPGGFLTAVLANDLFGAVGRADAENSQALKAIVEFVYNQMPSNSWGSREAVQDWLYQHHREQEL